MPRVKGGYTTRRRRKAVLKLAKGYYGSKHTLYKTAHEQVMRSLQYAFRDRKQRKREFRKLWIQRINAACQLNGLKYNQFINGLAQADVVINRKMLAELAVNDAEGFKSLCEVAKKGLANPKAKVAEETVFLKTESKAKKAENKANAKPAAKKATVKAAPKAAKAEVKAEAPKAEKKAAPKAAKVEDLSSKTVAELKEIAASKGVKIPSGSKKADIIELLK
ncbi:MAG: 50S ribosomal protein L20 [Acholeplasmatales bacterium]|nr:50S ribosomal protein L20 [Acholeplasmatales bacterium]